MPLVLGFLFLIAALPFLFFQLPQGKKSFIGFAIFLFFVICAIYYDYYDCVNNNRFYRHGYQIHSCMDERDEGMGIGWAMVRIAMMSSLVSLITRGITLYFYKESRLKRVAVAAFALSLTCAAIVFLKW
jgi:hypothetical protein